MSSKDNKQTGVVYLILLFVGVNILVSYWQIIAISLGIIAALAMSGFALNLVLKSRKIRQIRQSDVISIPSQALYSIPVKVEKSDRETDQGETLSRWMVTSFRPELINNNLNFVKLNHELGKVKVLRSDPIDPNYQTTKQISSLTKEIFSEIDPQLLTFEKQDAELRRLEKLVETSELYHSKTELYQRGRVQIQQLIQQTENLKREYCKCIREILIAAEISQFDPNGMNDILERKLTLHSKYEAFKSEYEDRKIEIDVQLSLTT